MFQNKFCNLKKCFDVSPYTKILQLNKQYNIAKQEKFIFNKLSKAKNYKQ